MRSTRLLRISALTLALCCFQATMVIAQSNEQGQIRGTVMDSRIWVKQMVHESGAPCVTEMLVLKRFERRVNNVSQPFALIEARPRTGRMHQIRLQASQHGWPIRGDQLYGSQLRFGPSAELPRDRIIALHARTLTFLQPIRYEPVTIEASLPEAWQQLGIE